MRLLKSRLICSIVMGLDIAGHWLADDLGGWLIGFTSESDRIQLAERKRGA